MNAKRVVARLVSLNAGFYYRSGLIVLILAAGLLTYHIDHPGAYPVSLLPEDPAVFSKASDTYASSGSLLISLATGLLVGMGWVFTNVRPVQRFPVRDLLPAIAAAVCACLSLYFGYISSQNIQSMIESPSPTLDSPTIQWPRNIQFYTILLGVYFFAVFLTRDWNNVNRHED